MPPSSWIPARCRVRDEGRVRGEKDVVVAQGRITAFSVIPASEPVSSKPPRVEYLPEVKHSIEQLDPGSLSRPG